MHLDPSPCGTQWPCHWFTLFCCSLLICDVFRLVGDPLGLGCLVCNLFCLSGICNLFCLSSICNPFCLSHLISYTLHLVFLFSFLLVSLCFLLLRDHVISSLCGCNLHLH